jgi:hypothetical protein
MKFLHRELNSIAFENLLVEGERESRQFLFKQFIVCMATSGKKHLLSVIIIKKVMHRILLFFSQ